jgi:hypothetical protein
MWKSPRAMALSRSLAALGLLLFAASPAVAQGTAVVCGTVTDASGGVVPGVAVSVERDAASPLKAVTDGTGDYVFAAVEPGTYRVVFFQEGFKKTVRLGVLVNAGREFRVDQRMEVGSPVTFDEPPQGALPTVAYDRPTRTGSTFTKNIVTAVPTGRPRPCKIEKH